VAGTDKMLRRKRMNIKKIKAKQKSHSRLWLEKLMN
jgi:hypothetical protein